MAARETAAPSWKPVAGLEKQALEWSTVRRLGLQGKAWGLRQLGFKPHAPEPDMSRTAKKARTHRAYTLAT